MEENTTRRGLSAFTLKLLMAGLMVLDHIHAFFPGAPEWFHWLGRLVAPVFCFLMTESLRHTRDRRGYLLRLSAAAAVMFCSNWMLAARFGEALTANIFFSLTVSAAVICLLEGGGREVLSAARLSLALGLVVFSFPLCEGGPMLPVMAVVFYFLRGRPLLMSIGYLISSVASVTVFYAYFYLSQGYAFHMGVTMPQLLMVFAILPILCYSGERGRSGRVAKWFFYLFYPLHLWLFYLIAQIAGIE